MITDLHFAYLYISETLQQRIVQNLILKSTMCIKPVLVSRQLKTDTNISSYEIA